MGEGKKCVKSLEEDFNRYDQYVDVVSCWEEFLNTVYSSDFNDFHFERFPSISNPNGGNSLTPDFSVFFNDDYGIVFEISRTLPQDKEKFEKEVSQLASYDGDLALKTGNGEKKVPKTLDIVLLVSSGESKNIAKRLNHALENEFDFDANLILLDYTYTNHDANPYYKFKRSEELDNFRDDTISEDKQLSKKMSIDDDDPYGDEFEAVRVSPSKFCEYKATRVLMNDSPEPIYLSCYMWHEVFYDYLKQNQRMHWARKNPNKILSIEIDLKDLKEKLNNDYIPDYNIRVKELRQTFKFLADSELATRKSKNKYEVDFRNLNKVRLENDIKTNFKGLASLIAKRYCKYQEDWESPEDDDNHIPEDKEEKQQTLDDL